MILDLKKVFSFFLILLFFYALTFVNAKSEEVKEILENIQKDLRTLERAVY